jgi:hypothetical protein
MAKPELIGRARKSYVASPVGSGTATKGKS